MLRRQSQAGYPPPSIQTRDERSGPLCVFPNSVRISEPCKKKHCSTAHLPAENPLFPRLLQLPQEGLFVFETFSVHGGMNFAPARQIWAPRFRCVRFCIDAATTNTAVGVKDIQTPKVPAFQNNDNFVSDSNEQCCLVHSCRWSHWCGFETTGVHALCPSLNT